MRIRINLGRIRRLQKPEAATFVSGLRRWLTPVSAVAVALALWRLAYDLHWARRFAISGGLFSHWQVWMGLALLLQVLDTMLGRYHQGGAATR